MLSETAMNVEMRSHYPENPMDQEVGSVIEVEAGKAKVLLSRREACQHCAARAVCHMVEGDNKMVVEALDDLGVAVGQKVRLAIEPRGVITAAFLLYIVPILAFFLGYFVGIKASLVLFNAVDRSQLVGAISGITFSALTFIIIRAFNNRFAQAKRLMPRIVQIESD